MTLTGRVQASTCAVKSEGVVKINLPLGGRAMGEEERS